MNGSGTPAAGAAPRLRGAGALAVRGTLLGLALFAATAAGAAAQQPIGDERDNSSVLQREAVEQPAAVRERAQPAADPYVGTYRFAPERSADVEQAIERGTEDLNFLIRGIARRRLRGTTQPYRTIRIQRSDGEIATIYDGREPIRSPADGRAVTWRREDGEVLQLSTRERDGALVQTFVAEDGTRENAFRVSDDGSTLTLTVTVRSDRLPEPIVFDLVYGRE